MPITSRPRSGPTTPEPVESPPTRIRSRTFGALVDNPEYRRFYIGHGISMIGTWVQNAAALWVVFEITGSEWWLGVIEACGLMPGLVVGLFAGALADRVAPRRMIALTLLGQMALAFLLAYLVWDGRIQIWQMAVILALTRVCVAFEMPTRQVLLYDLVGRESLMNAIALNSGMFNASRVLGPALAGQLLATVGAAACFALNGLSFVAAYLALLTIGPRPKPVVPEGEPRGLASMLAGLRFVRNDRRVGVLYALMILFGILVMGYSAMLPAYARLVVGTGAIGYSALLSGGGLGATFGALVVASLGGLRRKEYLVLSGMAIGGVSLGCAGLIPPAVAAAGLTKLVLPAAVLCLFCTGFGMIMFYSSTQTLIQTAVPDHLRGRIMGIWMIAFSGSVPLGALWAGWIARQIGVAPIMQLSAVLSLVMAVVVRFWGVLEERESPGSLETVGGEPETARSN